MLTDGENREDTEESQDNSQGGEGESEDTSESSDQENEESQDDSEDGDEAEVSRQFFDPNQIPAELKPAWKRMQASFTRKMQGLSMSQRKAAAFDQMLQDPNFQAYLNRGQAPAPKPASGDGEGGEAEAGSADAIRGMIREELGAALRPQRQIEAQKAIADELAKFKSDFPMWENYKAEMMEEMSNNPHLTYEQAFKAVAFNDAVKAGGATRLSSKKKANINQPSRVGGGSKPAPKKINSIQDAFDLAKAQMAGKGNR